MGLGLRVWGEMIRVEDVGNDRLVMIVIGVVRVRV